MSDAAVPGRILDRLRANLHAAGIPFTEVDIDGILEKNFLSSVLEFESLANDAYLAAAPDYLGAWGDEAESELPGANLLAFPPPTDSDTQLDGASIRRISRLLERREISPVELTRAALDRVAERNPSLNAFQVVLEREAFAAARVAERAILDGDYIGGLHGVPVAVKDLLALAGTPTTAGSASSDPGIVRHDSSAVDRLRRAGAMIIGKTTLAELAYSPGSNNAHYGPTRNPWNLAHDTGGSSSGSAAAVAADLVYAALGSDTGGSIRIPAAQCGIVGLKPTYGRISMHGVTPLAWSLDHLGPMTRSVSDAALLLQVLAGRDPRDPRTRIGTTYRVSAELEAGARGVRIGIVRNDGTGTTLGTPEVLAARHNGIEALERQGADIVELDLPELSALRIVNNAILVLEAAAYHEKRLCERLHMVGEFARHRLLYAYAHAPGAFVRAQQIRAVLRGRMQEAIEETDLLCTPSMPAPAPLLGTPSSTRYTAPFNALGWPAVTVPVGLASGNLPLGLQLIGPPWTEARLLQIARVVELEGPWRHVQQANPTSQGASSDTQGG